MYCGFDFVVSMWWKKGEGWRWQMKMGWIGSGCHLDVLENIIKNK
jgi:hypothetical protein